MSVQESEVRAGRLVRVVEFQRMNQRLFPTEVSLRHYVKQRRTNGLLKSGAVLETRIGIFIDPIAFLDWLFDRSESKAA